MSRRGVIPPASAGGLSDGETMDALRRRMDSAEDDTKKLVDQLSNLGFAPVHNQQSTGSISPFKVRISEPDVLHKNYEQLVARVCKSESALQTLKLNLMRVQSECDLNKKEKIVTSDKINQVADAYECEIKRLHKENSTLKKERSTAWEIKQASDDKLKQLHQVLEQEEKHKTEIAMEAEDVQAQNQKLQRRVNELREQVARETSLRASLEESHKSLLQRIHDMEAIVQTEREEVNTLNSNCLSLKRDTVRATEETDLERQLRQQMQEQIQQMNSKEQLYIEALAKLENDKQMLLDQVSTINKQYHQLNQQLDHMKQLFDEKKDQQTELAMRTQNGELATELQRKLKEGSREKAQAEQKCNQLQLQIREMKSQVASQQNQIPSLQKQIGKEQEHWKKQLRLAEEEKERVLKDKETLLEEVNAAVDSMTEEKLRLEAQIEEGRIEMHGLENSRSAVEMENKRLLERVNAMDDHMSAQQRVEQTLQDMVEQKNKLAYEKGKLQTQVHTYQREIESLASAQSELNQHKKLNATLEAKLSKVQVELQDNKLAVQRLESQLEHGGKSAQRSQWDFELAIKARDDAVKEAQRLVGHIETLEDRGKKASSGVERNLEDSRADNRKLSATLESVMHSHTRMQHTLEQLQGELGKKDATVSQLNKDKMDLQHKLHKYEKETEMLQNRVAAIETYETTEIEPVRKNLLKMKNDNVKMATSVGTLLKANSQLQGTLEGMQDQLEQKTHLLQQLQGAREQDQESHKQEVRNYEERIDNFKQQLKKERDKSIKKTNKDVAEVRRQLEDILSKNGELSRANSDLRHKLTELEYQMKDQRDKLAAHKRHTEHLTKSRQKQDKAIAGLEGIHEQVKELEKAKNYYIKKNKEQAKTVKTFMSQIAELQGEIKALAQSQIETTAILQEQEDQLSKERQHTEAWKNKYRASIKGTLQESKSRELKLEELQRQAEERLNEVTDESTMMSTSMHDAQQWFKSRFDTLQDELKISKRGQDGVERENYEIKALLEDEKRKADDVARRAQAMIRASRETVSRLADYAEDTNQDATDHLYTLRAQLEAERENSMHSELKLREFQESSLRHTEELARELEYLKSQQALDYDS